MCSYTSSCKRTSNFLRAETVNCASYLLNSVTLSRTEKGKTAYEAWSGKKPALEHLKVIGSEAFMHQDTNKLELNSKSVVLVGYERDSANYRVYCPKTKKVHVAKHVTVNEHSDSVFNQVLSAYEGVDLPQTTKDEVDDAEDQVQNILENDHQARADEPEPVVPKKKNAVQKPAAATMNLRDRSKIQVPVKYSANIAIHEVPASYEEAVSSKDAHLWRRAIKDELEAQHRNCTWQFVAKSAGMRTIDSKWVFKISQDPEGTTHKFKARLCARGFLQHKGKDYTETFALVVRYDTLRTLLAHVTQEDLEMITFDICTAFLHGDLEETIYMEVPQGVEDQVSEYSSESVVCLLKKSLYGLKQAPRCRNTKFKKFLAKFNFIESEADHSLFIANFKIYSVYLALFVDDGLLACKSMDVINMILHALKSEYDITIGDASFLVGMKIHRERMNKTTFVNQSAYINKIVERFGMSDAKELSVPAD